VVLVQQTDGTRALYIDGVQDLLGVPTKPTGNWNVNATSVGGILRSAAAAWPTALLDEVALWKRALTPDEITQLKNDGLKSVFPPLANGLVAHWPLDAVVGGRFPDQVGGYDLSAYTGAAHTLTNGGAVALVAGHKSNCVSFVSADRVLLGYVASPNDELPINKNPAITVSFWVNAAGNQSDLRMFSEGNLANNNPLFNMGTSSGGAGVDLFFRQQPSASELAAGYGDFGAGTHIVSTAAAYDNTWHHVVLVQQVDGTRALYIDAVQDALGVPTKPAGNWNVNATSVGGILRSAAAAWPTALIDEVALWKRALTPAEITDLKDNGVPKAFRRKLPLQIKTFLADREAVTRGDTVVLSWDGSTDASYSISPGIGDVSGRTSFGVGSTTVVVNASTTYTITASRATESTNKTVHVDVVDGVAPGWRVIENFEFLTVGYIGGQAQWQNALTSISGALRPANAVDTEATNRYLGFDGENVLAGKPLNSMTMPEGARGTFFFRFYLLPDPVNLPPDIDINLGLTEKGLRDVQDMRGGNNGPSVRIFRQGGTPIDLRANNGVTGAAGSSTYSWVGDATHNPTGAGLETGVVYDLWMDIENRPFDVVAGVQNGGDLYSVYLQKAGESSRTTLFEGFKSDRDAVNIDVVLGAPGTALTHLFLCANNQISPQGTNKVRLDDFYINTAGYNATVPVPAGAFRSPIRLTGVQLDASGLSLSWKGIPGKTYNIYKRITFNATDPWGQVGGAFPVGGAVDENLTFVDADALFDSQSFYYVVENP